ncbi:MAG TPA: hypothetical protein VH583_01825 [Vicinamibacterales bacterium]|jgi:hypothetical protein
MRKRLAHVTVVAWTLFLSRDAIGRQTQSPALLSSKKQTFSFVGCVKNVLSDKPWAAIQDTDTGVTYSITNFNLKDYGGKKVSIVVTLQPSASLAGQMSSVDRSRLIILAGAAAPKALPSSPTAHVVKLRTLEVCPE